MGLVKLYWEKKYVNFSRNKFRFSKKNYFLKFGQVQKFWKQYFSQRNKFDTIIYYFISYNQDLKHFWAEE